MCNKKNTLIVSLVGVLLFVLFLFAKNLGLCAFINSSCTETFDPIAENISVFIPLFILSIVTYKMRDEVYHAWLRFAQWWIPLSILAIFLAPEYSSDWMFPVEKGTVAFFSSLLFVIISLLIIAWKYLSPRAKYKDDFKEGSRT